MSGQAAEASGGAAGWACRWRALRLSWLMPVALAVWVLLPRMAGPAYELKLPVQYAQVRLEQQAPVVLELSLPAAEYTVAPVSLGYFTSSQEFVYTAAVSRGLIYGVASGNPVVVEVVALPDAEQFVETHLSTLRDEVQLLNQRQNDLRLQRLAWPPPATAAEREADQLWLDLRPTPGQAAATRWPVGCPQGSDAGYLFEFSKRLLTHAGQAAELKRLFFEAQAARIDLLLRQYEFQLALARLPKPEIAGLLSLGDEQVIRSGCLAELSRLEQAWLVRQDDLSRLLESDSAWARRLTGQAEAPPSNPVAALPGAPPEAGGSVGDAPLGADPRQDAEKALVAARLLAEQAELDQLAAILNQVRQAGQQVAQSGEIDSRDLPRQAVVTSRLSLSGCENTPAYAAVLASVTNQPAALALLIRLACSFEAGEGRDPPPGADSNQARSTLQLNEVSLGLLLLDQLAEVPAVQPVSLGTATPVGGQLQQQSLLPLAAHLELIQSVLEKPDAFGIAAYDLGYLKLLAWYGTLILDDAERTDLAEREPANPQAE